MGGILIGRDRNELAEHGRWMQSFLPALDGVDPEAAAAALRQRGWLVGTPEEVSEQLKPWSVLGVQRVMLQWFNLDNVEGLSLLAEVQRG
jgi:alkanesulfonate monooxygenase SsuD/methylene tetrahydromethanopterin reductase-like flavin-dependent oxidoreductase (luciferase family)